MNKLILVLTIVILFVLFALGIRVLNFGVEPLATEVVSAANFLMSMTANAPDWLDALAEITLTAVASTTIFIMRAAQVFCSAAFAWRTIETLVLPFIDDILSTRQETKAGG